MMDKQEAFNILNQTGAIVQNTHVVLKSFRHSASYLNKDAIYPHTEMVSRLCFSIAQLFQDVPIQVVAAPEKGGIILSQWVAHHLTEINRKGYGSNAPQVLAAFAEKQIPEYGSGEKEMKFVFKRGYAELVTGAAVLVVEDILTTGGSAKLVVEAVHKIGGETVGLGAILNRGGVTANDLGNVPLFFSLLDSIPGVDFTTWEPMECPLCKAGVPFNTDIGHGR